MTNDAGGDPQLRMVNDAGGDPQLRVTNDAGGDPQLRITLTERSRLLIFANRAESRF